MKWYEYLKSTKNQSVGEDVADSIMLLIICLLLMMMVFS